MAFEFECHAAEIVRLAEQASDNELVITALAIEGDAKREAPVRGAYRSFRQGLPPIGGALRRSYTTAKPGQVGPIEGGGNATGNVVDGGIDVGSWLHYSYYVDRGTSIMPPRPHFSTAVAQNIPQRGRRFEQEFTRLTAGKYR